MTDENQNPGTENPTGSSEFLKTENQQEQKTEGSFNRDEIEKILKENSNAQSFIKELKSETSEMRSQIKTLQEELAKSRTIDDLFSKYGQQDFNEPGPNTPQVNEQELLAKLKAEVFAELSAEQQKAQEENNWRTALKQAEERFGEKYGSYVDARAQELGISIDDMRTYARTSPKVFLELLGGSQQRQTPRPTQSSQSGTPPGIGDDIEKQYARYVRLRNQPTEEGRQAREMLADPAFMEQYRLRILSSVTKG